MNTGRATADLCRAVLNLQEADGFLVLSWNWASQGIVRAHLIHVGEEDLSPRTKDIGASEAWPDWFGVRPFTKEAAEVCAILGA